MKCPSCNSEEVIIKSLDDTVKVAECKCCECKEKWINTDLTLSEFKEWMRSKGYGFTE